MSIYVDQDVWKETPKPKETPKIDHFFGPIIFTETIYCMLNMSDVVFKKDSCLFLRGWALWPKHVKTLQLTWKSCQQGLFSRGIQANAGMILVSILQHV